MFWRVISVALLVGSGCGSDAGTSPATGYPKSQDSQAMSQSSTTTGSTTGSGIAGMAGFSGLPGTAGIAGQPDTGNGNTGGQTSTAAETASGQTSTASASTSAQTSGTSATTSGGGSSTTPALSFAVDIWPLWSMVRDPVFVYRGMGSYSGCTDVGVCHGGGNPGAGLRMPDQQTTYAQMIDTPSVSSICAGTQRVVAGDPENSCLILFYQGRLGKDDLGWVDDAEIELMREWIRQGALP